MSSSGRSRRPSGGGGGRRFGRKRTNTSDDAVLDVGGAVDDRYDDDDEDDDHYYRSREGRDLGSGIPAFVRSSETEPEPYVPLSMDSSGVVVVAPNLTRPGASGHQHGAVGTVASSVSVSVSDAGSSDYVFPIEGHHEMQRPQRQQTIATSTSPASQAAASPKALKGLTGKISTLFRRSDHHHGGGGGGGGTTGHSGRNHHDVAAASGYRTPPPAGAAAGLSPRSLASSLDPAGLTPPGRSHEDRFLRAPAAAAGTSNASPPPSAPVSQLSSTSMSPTSQNSHPRPGGAGLLAVFQKGAGQRIFYSSHADDSDDSYEAARAATKTGGGGGGGGGGSSRGAPTASRSASRDRERDGPKKAASSAAKSKKRGPVPPPIKVGSSASAGKAGRTAQRLSSGGGSNVYSIDGDDEDDNEDDEGTYDEATQTTYDDLASPRIVRFRGFSTSIKSLFLDEALVCGSMGCFGLLLSNRTEYLLALRNERRGTLSPRNGERRHKLPSKVVAYGLILTILLMFSTFMIWGFGTGHGLADYAYTGYDTAFDNMQADDGGNNNGGGGYYNNYNDDGNYQRNGDDGGGQQQQQNDDGGNQNQNGDDAANQNGGDDGNDDGNRRRRARSDARWPRRRDAARTAQIDESGGVGVGVVVAVDRRYHPVHGIAKLRDLHENVYEPIWEFVQAEWYRGEEANESVHSIWQRQHRRARDGGGISYYDVVADDSLEMKYTQQQRDIGANIRTALLFTFLVFLGILGRRRRMRTRFYLVRARAQEDHLYYASAQVGSIKSMNSPGSPTSLNTARTTSYENLDRENQYEGACSHTLCGCYPVDEVPYEEAGLEEVKVNDWGILRRKKKPHHEDIVARAFNCCMAVCCGALCKCWFQCLSICALAQEAREVRLLLPTRYQRIDFITHQPFHEYHQNVTDLRLGWMGKTRRISGILPHYNALSRLSRYIVMSGSLAVVAIVATLMFNPRAAFSWQDAVVLAATFLSSFLVLFVVHWIFHKSDLSLDAVIKLFAAGFLIAVPSAFFFEALMVNMVCSVAWTVFKIGELSAGETFSAFVFDHWRIIWIFGELFNAYVVAAITEELCKYYTFRAVEHPDLMFLTGLSREDHDGEGAVAGGVVQYPFSSHQVSDMNRDDDSVSQRSSRSRNSHRSNRSNSMKRKPYSNRGLADGLIDDKDDFKVEEPDVRTHRQRAMAITTGMISVAVGLACAENMLYVFVLGGAMANDKGGDLHTGDLIEAWIILFVRSIFPIHALAAAMQSINMIRKFVESTEDGGHRIGVGRIILPAVILHGTFDAVLLGITVYSETAWDIYLDENDGRYPEDGTPYNALILNTVAALSVFGIMMMGIVWYFRENRLQSKRLKELEEIERAKWLSSGRKPHDGDGEVELV